MECRKASPASVLECRHCKAKFPENRVPYRIKYDHSKADVTTTEAFIQAEHIESLKPAAFLMLTVGVGIVTLANLTGPIAFLWLLVVPLVSSVLALFTIVRWVDRFSACASSDADFMTAFRKVRGAFWIWLAVMLAQVGGLLTLVRTP